MMHRGAVAALLFLLLAGAACAQSIQDDLLDLAGQSKAISCGQSGSRDPMAWIVLGWLALVIGAVAYAGVVAVKGVLGGQKYDAAIKAHLWLVLETAMMMAIVTASFAGLQEFGVRNLDSARAYSVVIRNTVTADFGMVVVASIGMSFASRQVVPLRLHAAKIFGISFQLAPMFRPVFDGLGTITQLISVAILEWTAHEFVLCFIKNGMLTFLMPAGFFLRSYGIKGMGNALIGLAIALYFVYPYLITVAGQMLDNYLYKIVKEGRAGPISCIPSSSALQITPHANDSYVVNGPKFLNASEILKGDLPLYILPVTANPVTLPAGVATSGPVCYYDTMLTAAYKPFFQLLDTFGAWGLGFAAAGGMAMNVFYAKFLNLSWITLTLAPVMIVFVLYGIYEMVFFFFVVGIVLPLMMIFITLTLAKEVTKALGTEIDLSALEKLI